MKATRIREIASRVYDNVEVALWAMLFAFVIYFITFILPKMPEIQAQNERIRVEEIAVENGAFCKQLDIKQGTANYNQCLLDVGQFRLKVEQRVHAEDEF